MRSAITLLLLLALAACGKDPPVVYVDRPIEVRVPVSTPCMGRAPDPIEALRDTIGRDEWDALSTDQRANLIAANALAWRIYAWQASDASAGCK